MADTLYAALFNPADYCQVIEAHVEARIKLVRYFQHRLTARANAERTATGDAPPPDEIEAAAWALMESTLRILKDLSADEDLRGPRSLEQQVRDNLPNAIKQAWDDDR